VEKKDGKRDGKVKGILLHAFAMKREERREEKKRKEDQRSIKKFNIYIMKLKNRKRKKGNKELY